MEKAGMRLGIAFTLGGIGIALAAASVGLHAFPNYRGCRNERGFHLVVLGLWLVVPPVWFMVETLHFAKTWTHAEKAQPKGNTRACYKDLGWSIRAAGASWCLKG
jgi:hypothetical protein